jgi:hypothetical protein
MRKARIAFFLIIVPFLLCAQQQNEGDSPSGKIHFVVRGGDDEKKIYLSVPGANSKEVELCETPGWGNLVVHFHPMTTGLSFRMADPVSAFLCVFSGVRRA